MRIGQVLPLLCVFYALCGIFSTAFATEKPTCLSPTYAACIEMSEGITVNLVECIEAERKVVQAHIEELYKSVAAQQNDARNADLDKAIQAWKNYRKEMGAFFYDPEGGYSARIISLSWSLSETDRLCLILKSLP